MSEHLQAIRCVVCDGKGSYNRMESKMIPCQWNWRGEVVAARSGESIYISGQCGICKGVGYVVIDLELTKKLQDG